MSQSLKRIDWSRLLIEGIVIVVSILLAFAIDAWWDERQEFSAQTERLVRVAAELRSNAERVAEQQEVLEGAIDAGSTMLSWMGPEPAEVEQDLFFDTETTLLSIGTFSLLRRATDEYLASAEAGSSSHDQFRDALSELYFSGDSLEGQYALLRGQHANLINYTSSLQKYPTLATMSRIKIMREHPKSKFPFDQNSFLGDPVGESRLAIYMIRMEFVTSEMAYFQETQAKVLASIEAELSRRS